MLVKIFFDSLSVTLVAPTHPKNNRAAPPAHMIDIPKGIMIMDIILIMSIKDFQISEFGFLTYFAPI